MLLHKNVDYHPYLRHHSSNGRAASGQGGFFNGQSLSAIRKLLIPVSPFLIIPRSWSLTIHLGCEIPGLTLIRTLNDLFEPLSIKYAYFFGINL
jgi:hypothetical protein